mmetsp:Transcript_19263/g.65477  ORF Transcript_19263/g.65477 Transcript_19263/m.65477 type:complete len:202 (-) Transcript_19263:231-836(-)
MRSTSVASTTHLCGSIGPASHVTPWSMPPVGLCSASVTGPARSAVYVTSYVPSPMSSTSAGCSAPSGVRAEAFTATLCLRFAAVRALPRRSCAWTTSLAGWPAAQDTDPGPRRMEEARHTSVVATSIASGEPSTGAPPSVTLTVCMPVSGHMHLSRKPAPSSRGDTGTSATSPLGAVTDAFTASVPEHLRPFLSATAARTT